jgi:hypothetical protein
MTYTPPAPATGRRKLIYVLGILCGVVMIFVTWTLVLAGVLPATPTDDVVSAIMLFALFTPFAAFWDNPGESRASLQRLAEFSFGWLLLSGIAQTFWELPWFFMDLTGVVQHIGPDDRWLWPWWAYGNADTRYLTSNPAIAGIEFCAGFAGPFELLGCYYFVRGKRVAANWLALLLGVGLTWGTLVFFVAEIHVGFVNVKDGAFGFWVKWLGLNLPWAISPFFFIPASILELRELYVERGKELALEAAPRPGPRLVAYGATRTGTTISLESA